MRAVIAAWLVIVLVIGVGLSAVSSSADTQADLNAAAEKQLASAEADMQSALGFLVKRSPAESEAALLLDAAQRAWVQYRDSQIRAMWPFPEKGKYGSVYPMCATIKRAELTRARSAELRAMLEGSEGDVCGGAWPE